MTILASVTAELASLLTGGAVLHFAVVADRVELDRLVIAALRGVYQVE